ncbi:DNA topoisomerase IB [Nocardioides sp. B-3]|uniref:DNA topoisomerase IB n=1 Tax=Nocardioides sp. B-3 TaxID=2895565 RepID=UPI0021523D31|nr:hypothetical protein [Nocardioides sp. B-3]UUZ60637.1 hypothetical protein LP418_07355 [Nocardioides sp. B-3]
MDIHPFVAHYRGADCSPIGTTGEWHAATGNSAGWQEWDVDLSAYAGQQVEVSISYLTDWGTPGPRRLRRRHRGAGRRGADGDLLRGRTRRLDPGAGPRGFAGDEQLGPHPEGLRGGCCHHDRGHGVHGLRCGGPDHGGDAQRLRRPGHGSPPGLIRSQDPARQPPAFAPGATCADMPRLRRTSTDQPGWSRRRAGKGFTFVDDHGKALTGADRQRCRDLVIPPAWTDVWITPHANGHLQAVGTDDAGRRQYLYHPDWRTSRDAEKYARLVDFGKALSRARERVLTDLDAEGMSLERACAVAVRLLDPGCFRIGNDVYADTNGSFGLTTLRKEHVTGRGGTLTFRFTGKSGIEHSIDIDDAPTVVALDIMRRRRGGSEQLLAWKDGTRWRDLDSSRVNDYVREATGIEATAKDFRTWHATVLAAVSLAETDEPGETKASRKRAVTRAMKEVAEFLGNTPALARSAYVDPRVIEAYESGSTITNAARRSSGTSDERQAALERATLKLLRER